MADKTVSPATGIDDNKKEEINWISFYLFLVTWVSDKIDATSYDKPRIKNWVIGIRAFIGFVIAMIIIFSLSLGSLITSFQLAAFYIAFEVLVFWIIYLVIKDEEISTYKDSDKINYKLFYDMTTEKDGTETWTLMNAMEAYKKFRNGTI